MLHNGKDPNLFSPVVSKDNINSWLTKNYKEKIIYENDWFVALLINRLCNMNRLGKYFWAWVPGVSKMAVEKWGWKVWRNGTVTEWQKKEAAPEID